MAGGCAFRDYSGQPTLSPTAPALAFHQSLPAHILSCHRLKVPLLFLACPQLWGLNMGTSEWRAARSTCRLWRDHICAGITTLELDLERDAHRASMVRGAICVLHSSTCLGNYQGRPWQWCVHACADLCSCIGGQCMYLFSRTASSLTYAGCCLTAQHSITALSCVHAAIQRRAADIAVMQAMPCAQIS